LRQNKPQDGEVRAKYNRQIQMSADKIDNFNEKATTVFRSTLEKYGYLLEEIKVNYINGQKWSTHHIYSNKQANLKIIIKQEPFYTDYGFSFFIYDLGMEQYNILYNVPHERQDNGDNFLYMAYEELFSNKETSDQIGGISWKKLGHIPFQK
jgi:hypothetical protein